MCMADWEWCNVCQHHPRSILGSNLSVYRTVQCHPVGSFFLSYVGNLVSFISSLVNPGCPTSRGASIEKQAIDIAISISLSMSTSISTSNSTSISKSTWFPCLMCYTFSGMYKRWLTSLPGWGYFSFQVGTWRVFHFWNGCFRWRLNCGFNTNRSFQTHCAMLVTPGAPFHPVLPRPVPLSKLGFQSSINGCLSGQGWHHQTRLSVVNQSFRHPRPVRGFP